MTEYIINVRPKTIKIIPEGEHILQQKLDKLPFKHVRVKNYSIYECLVRCSEFGYSLLRLEFNNKYYEIKAV